MIRAEAAMPSSGRWPRYGTTPLFLDAERAQLSRRLSMSRFPARRSDGLRSTPSPGAEQGDHTKRVLRSWTQAQHARSCSPATADHRRRCRFWRRSTHPVTSNDSRLRIELASAKSVACLSPLADSVRRTQPLARRRRRAQRELPEWMARRGMSCRTSSNEAHTLSYAGNYREARQSWGSRRRSSPARRRGALAAQVWFHIVLGEIDRDCGYGRAAIEHFEAAANLAVVAGQSAAGVEAWVGVAQGRLLLGDSAAGAEALDRADASGASPVATSWSTTGADPRVVDGEPRRSRRRPGAVVARVAEVVTGRWHLDVRGFAATRSGALRRPGRGRSTGSTRWPRWSRARWCRRSRATPAPPPGDEPRRLRGTGARPVRVDGPGGVGGRGRPRARRRRRAAGGMPGVRQPRHAAVRTARRGFGGTAHAAVAAGHRRRPAHQAGTRGSAACPRRAYPAGNRGPSSPSRSARSTPIWTGSIASSACRATSSWPGGAREGPPYVAAGHPSYVSITDDTRGRGTVSIGGLSAAISSTRTARHAHGMKPPSSPSTYTFLFTDMEGSTARWEQAPEMSDLVEAISTCSAIAVAPNGRHGVRHHGGRRRRRVRLGAAARPRAAIDARQQDLRHGGPRYGWAAHRRGSTRRRRLPRPHLESRRTNHAPATAVRSSLRRDRHFSARASTGRPRELGAAPTT